MSYDISLHCTHCYQDSVLSWNYTSNCSPMWRLAGADLAEFNNKLASECAPLLRAAIADMEAHPEKYTPLNPENGWGSYAGLVIRLRELLAKFEEYPTLTVSVWR